MIIKEIKDKYPKKNIREIVMLIVMLATLAIGWCIDKNIINNLPEIILINNDMATDITLYIFAAQVTVSTLGTAVISILAGMSNEKIYGISISQYIMQDRPKIFKHKIILRIQILAIIFSYCLMALQKYNLLVGLFFVSIFISCIMVNDMFIIFYGNGYIRKEMHGYILNVFKVNKSKNKDKSKSILNEMKEDTLDAIDKGNISLIKENLNLFQDILSEPCINNIKEKEDILEIFEDNISEVFENMLKENDIKKNKIALECMENLYGICNKFNKDNKETIHLQIFDNNFNYIIKAMSNILEIDDDYRAMFRLEYDLYENMYFKIRYIKQFNARKINAKQINLKQFNINKSDVKKVKFKKKYKMIPCNNIYLNIYSSRLYYEILKKESNDPKNIFDIKVKLYKRIKDIIEIYTFNSFKDEKIEQLFIQLYQYTKTLIDNKENKVLEKTLFKMINSMEYEYEYKKEKYEYIIIIMIYLYYLIKFENLADEELKKNCKNLIKSNAEEISNFLIYPYCAKVDKAFIEKAKSILTRWEIMPEEDAKWMMMDNVVEEFLLFFILQKNHRRGDLTDEIRVLVKNKESYMYERINKNSDIIEKYKSFTNMFYNDDISHEDAQSKIEMLQGVIIDLYKESEIKRSQTCIKTKEEIVTFEQKLKDICIEGIEDKIKIFNKKISSQNIQNKTIDILNLNTETELMSEDSIKNYINKYTYTYFIHNIISIIKDKALKVDVSENEDEFLEKLFNLNESSNIKIDTLIGYKRIFYKAKSNLVHDFRKFEEDKIKINANGCNKLIMGVDSSKFYLNIKEIMVNIEEPNMNEIYSKTPRDEKGMYLYEINRDIRLPFTKEELEQYIYNNRKLVKISAEIEYAFENSNIGIGVFMK